MTNVSKKKKTKEKEEKEKVADSEDEEQDEEERMRPFQEFGGSNRRKKTKATQLKKATGKNSPEGHQRRKPRKTTTVQTLGSEPHRKPAEAEVSEKVKGTHTMSPFIPKQNSNNLIQSPHNDRSARGRKELSIAFE